MSRQKNYHVARLGLLRPLAEALDRTSAYHKHPQILLSPTWHCRFALAFPKHLHEDCRQTQLLEGHYHSHSPKQPLWVWTIKCVFLLCLQTPNQQVFVFHRLKRGLSVCNVKQGCSLGASDFSMSLSSFQQSVGHRLPVWCQIWRHLLTCACTISDWSESIWHATKELVN